MTELKFSVFIQMLKFLQLLLKRTLYARQFWPCFQETLAEEVHQLTKSSKAKSNKFLLKFQSHSIQFKPPKNILSSTKNR